MESTAITSGQRLSSTEHPCQKCGACCSSFRVNFYWREAELKDNPSAVPQQYWQESSGSSRTMKGTESKHSPKCDALSGKVGDFVTCKIYDNRPSTCRNFEASFENGIHRPRCDEARKKHGLTPLGREVWSRFE